MSKKKKKRVKFRLVKESIRESSISKNKKVKKGEWGGERGRRKRRGYFQPEGDLSHKRHDKEGEKKEDLGRYQGCDYSARRKNNTADQSGSVPTGKRFRFGPAGKGRK